ncbi:hypothetical protein ACFDR9_002686 [Janthinobacterium sp. CG_23.3]|uniref:hypothetical protein n=1 Tax=Janthinobacterium sp. CG_23.3 TaxID=3349634 RepID=UPI0038D35E70
MIEWKTTKLSPSTWPEIPLIFDLEAGQPMIVASVHVSAGCEIYTKYVYRNRTWIEERLPDKFERRITNLLIRDGIDMPEFVSLKEKQRENANLGYRIALRQVGPVRMVCG